MSLHEAMSESPLKKKRGRPAKSNKLSNRITTRINIDVNTSPLSSSPTAESNALKSIEQGAPDCFTPLMRVSPTTRNTKRRRSNASLKTPSLKKPKSASSSKLTTPQHLSSADHISMLTSGDSNDFTTDSNNSRSGVPFHTPPSSVSSIRISSSMLAPPADLSKPFVGQRKVPKLAPDSPLLQLKDIDFKLTVDNLGKAVWSEGVFNFGIAPKRSATADTLVALSVPTPENSKDYSVDEIQLPVSPRGGLRRVNSDCTTISTSTTLTAFSSTTSTILNNNNKNIENKNTVATLPSLAYNTELLNHGSPTLPLILENTPKFNFVPQTPRSKENYFYGISTGLTPNPLMGTPHYNQFMFLVLDDAHLCESSTVNGLHSQNLMTSSPYKSQLLTFGNSNSVTGTPVLRNTLNNIAILRQRTKTEDFAINMNDLMKLESNNNNNGNEDPFGCALPSTHKVISGRSSPAKVPKEDTSDARLALKRIISTKRG